MSAERLVLDDVDKVFGGRRRGDEPVHAVDHVTFALEPGASLGLVGASGSGKSTIAKLVTGLERPTSGEVCFGDVRVDRLRRRGLRRLRSRVQMVFQDPYSALNPLHTVSYTLSRPLANYLGMRERPARARVRELLETVGLTPVGQFEGKLPHQLSGGQRQRVVIAGALVLEPEIIVADEPVSSLDASVRGEILKLLLGLRDDFGIAMLVVTHDLGLAWTIADRVAVMYLGRIVEIGPAEEVLTRPLHPYTKALLEVVPEAGGLDRPYLSGEPPDPTRIPEGCRFHPRCPEVVSGAAAAAGVEDKCRGEDLGLLELRPGHFAACHLAAARRDDAVPAASS